MNADIVKLRGHHLLCMLTYIGRGYTPTYTENFNQIANRIRNGAGIYIVRGPDDICAPMLTDGQHFHCHESSSGLRDVLAVQAVTKILERPVLPGLTLRLKLNDFTKMRRAFVDGSARAACNKCKWEDLCTDIAADQFQQTKLICGI